MIYLDVAWSAAKPGYFSWIDYEMEFFFYFLLLIILVVWYRFLMKCMNETVTIELKNGTVPIPALILFSPGVRVASNYFCYTEFRLFFYSI